MTRDECLAQRPVCVLLCFRDGVLHVRTAGEQSCDRRR